jgi:hypothetical protein
LLKNGRDKVEFRRCLVPADGFYEWQKTGKGKQPYCFEINDGEWFAFAGLWDRWNDVKTSAHAQLLLEKSLRRPIGILFSTRLPSDFRTLRINNTQVSP